MDFKDVIKQLSERVDKLKDNLLTEEATKNALIMPFLTAMGYDVFNPIEVVPEFTCDIGTKKGEKIDYAIFKDNQPIMLIECKHWEQDLNLHDNQLLRYFNVSAAKFGLLTNGIIYRFYTDLVTPNKMDEKPFLEIDLTDPKSNQVEELKKFHKAYFDLDNILNSANELKYTGELKSILSKEFTNPGPEFVKLLAKQVYDGIITAKLLDQFTVLVRKSISNHINDIINERLKTALKAEATEEKKQSVDDSSVVVAEKEDKIVTTEEEMEAFFIVKSILRAKIASERVTYRDGQTYFSVVIDEKVQKLICRLYLNSPKVKYISFFGEDKKEVKNKIQSLDEIYNFSEQLLSIVEKYI
ncbi:MAG: type I restriction enzyme HsdR N-terminal domain-containing protein [Candidatus Symbiothrix sp.]|jgi:hypothetical protein|nr:type I restriction enzyme HsdR N-terminal domain-containing protein [Candidatus Symbiothrix sp.]